MADDGSVQFLYRFGSTTDDALTPRPKDTTESPGSNPGLSVELDLPVEGKKAQKIDMKLLAGSGLGFLPDDPAAGGREGHGVIAPVDATGKVDRALLQDWVACRGTPSRHRFTQAVLNAIVERDVRSK